MKEVVVRFTDKQALKLRQEAKDACLTTNAFARLKLEEWARNPKPLESSEHDARVWCSLSKETHAVIAIHAQQRGISCSEAIRQIIEQSFQMVPHVS